MNLLKFSAGLLLLAIVFYVLIPSAYEIKNAVPRGEAIVCFGDSLTAGNGATKGFDYPAQLSRLTGKVIVNAGVPGDTTASALARVAEVIKLNPRIVLITLGGNDLKNGVAREVVFHNLEIIVGKFQENGSLVIIGGIDVPFWGRGFGDAYRKLARKTGSVLVPNIFQDIIGKSDLMSDRIHPNRDGYGLMAQHFYLALKPYI